MSEFIEKGKDNAAIRGYILRALIKGLHFSLMVRSISNLLVQSTLIEDADIWQPLKYLHDLGYIEFPDDTITPYNAFRLDALVRLSTAGVIFIERGGLPDDGGIDL